MNPVLATHTFTRCSVKLLADLQTPVGLYIKIRDQFPESILLESTDFEDKTENHSYIGFDPLARFSITNDQATYSGPEDIEQCTQITRMGMARELYDQFMAGINVSQEENPSTMTGVFGYCQYEAARYFDDSLSGMVFPRPSEEHKGIPEVFYAFFRFVIQFNHRENELILSEYIPQGGTSRMKQVMLLLDRENPKTEAFSRIEEETTVPRQEALVATLQESGHETRGLSRLILTHRHQQPFRGDDFMVYRALRSIAPSSYLFYFNFGDYRIFGYSPEPLLMIRQGKASLSPLAGQARRSGNEAGDKQIAHEMQFNNPQGSRAHEIIVNQSIEQLSRHTRNVRIESYCEVQQQTKMIRMISRISGELPQGSNSGSLFSEVFPSVILTGTPRLPAMKAIAAIEPFARGVFGGCIGYTRLNGDCVQAVICRSFLSRNHVLYSQTSPVTLQEEKILSGLSSDHAPEIFQTTLQKAETITHH